MKVYLVIDSYSKDLEDCTLFSKLHKAEDFIIEMKEINPELHYEIIERTLLDFGRNHE